MSEGKSLTVLVVDDAQGIVEIYDRWLGDDFEVLTATDGQTALATIDDSVDVLLIDRDLPSMSGSTVVEEIRELGHTPAVVLLSSVEPDHDVVDVEFHVCLTKPVMRRDLVEAVEQAGSGDRQGRTNETVAGPSLDDHAGETGPPPGEGDGGADDAGIGEGFTAGRTADAGEDGPGTATDDGDEEPATDVAERLRSLREDLEETATELSERADEREGSDIAATGDDDREDEEPTAPDLASTGDDDGTAETPRDVLDDDGDDDDSGVGVGWTELQDEDGESLQSRVEKLASRATELAEGDVEEDAGQEEAGVEELDGAE